MATLTETRIEIADRHTTLCQFVRNKSGAAFLDLSNRASYSDIYATVVDASTAYTSLTGRKGQVLDKVFSVFTNTKYWRRFLGRQPSFFETWNAALPLKASLIDRVEVVPPAALNVSVSPIPRVLIYPFGWSTWLSLRVTGEHTVEGLASLVSHLHSEKCVRPARGKNVITLQALMDDIADGVRRDAFCGADTNDTEGKGKAVVTTVLAKHGASPALGTLTETDEVLFKRLVRPEGPMPRSPFAKMVFNLDSDDGGLDYMVFDNIGRFIWMEHLLKPEDRNYQWLTCYHHNSFMSLLQAWQLEGFLTTSRKVRSKSVPLKELTEAAYMGLEEPLFENASLRAFLDMQEVQLALKRAKEI